MQPAQLAESQSLVRLPTPTKPRRSGMPQLSDAGRAGHCSTFAAFELGEFFLGGETGGYQTDELSGGGISGFKELSGGADAAQLALLHQLLLCYTNNAKLLCRDGNLCHIMFVWSNGSCSTLHLEVCAGETGGFKDLTENSGKNEGGGGILGGIKSAVQGLTGLLQPRTCEQAPATLF